MNQDVMSKIRKWVAEKKVTFVDAPKEIEVREPIPASTQETVIQKQELVESIDNLSTVSENLPINTIIHGDCIEVMKSLPDNSVTAIVTDPPYAWNFMSKEWDNPLREVHIEEEDKDHKAFDMLSFQRWTEHWAKEALRVLKPGGYLFSFCGPRTNHRMVCGIEDAGYQIRDRIDYLYTVDMVFGSGFPKSLNVQKQLQKMGHPDADKYAGIGSALKPAYEPCDVFAKAKDGEVVPLDTKAPFKYTAKTAKKERNAGCENLFWLTDNNGNTTQIEKTEFDRLTLENETRASEEGFRKHRLTSGNNHPTVKCLDFMRYLVRMVKHPGKNIILDPFAGSGSTLVACIYEGCDFIGIEQDYNNVIIARARVDYALSKTKK